MINNTIKASKRPLQIGDIVALPPDIDRDVAYEYARMQKTYRAKVKSGYDSPSTRAAKVAAAGAQQAEDRLRNPLEQAKTYLRKIGWCPVATMSKTDGGGHRVGRHRFETDQQLFEFAASKGWGINPALETNDPEIHQTP